MKFYLSSAKIGNETQKLMELTNNGNKKAAYINNALDFSSDLERRKESDANDIIELENVGFAVDILDLKQYFHNPVGLEKKLDRYDVIWVRGGNVFVLAQAAHLSGFDVIVKRYFKNEKDVLYGGYSAGICVLGQTLNGIHLMDESHQKPYKEANKVIWDGFGILDYAIVPHYQSDHSESENANKVVQYMIDHKIPFKALMDGDVIIKA